MSLSRDRGNFAAIRRQCRSILPGGVPAAEKDDRILMTLAPQHLVEKDFIPFLREVAMGNARFLIDALHHPCERLTVLLHVGQRLFPHPRGVDIPG